MHVLMKEPIKYPKIFYVILDEMILYDFCAPLVYVFKHYSYIYSVYSVSQTTQTAYTLYLDRLSRAIVSRHAMLQFHVMFYD